MLADNDVVATAEWLARNAHGDDRNKHNGEPYITHVERVVAHLIKAGATARVIAAAWLHDVVEDTWVTLNVLRGMGFDEDLVQVVDAVTHRKGETRLAYYDRLGRLREALAVKMSDLHDNIDPARKVGLPPETCERLRAKYEVAVRALAVWIVYHLERP